MMTFDPLCHQRFDVLHKELAYDSRRMLTI